MLCYYCVVNEEDEDDQLDFGSQVSLNSSTLENEAYVERETGTKEKFGVVRTISKDAKTQRRPFERLCDYDKFRDANWGE